ncbi:Probable transmembrane protein of unknown function [Flavobacterium indicum GPTSA100-9 = DSM 17447]|jgi:hypothetical protein|uniref:Uncharacterized protein n=1 Tax=Flavobacterium indicum (strain DSM 17447 / CIP 109464 / GPTSA100-9) TaxID=1094466 RepID=H8XQ66_FLAIG|nr:hypothetical protein [Flavobacterium indicum]CCG52360.1 Probable transmembrane protein of unknown function [Flavobacterium indicum GPTSA100-9 = DSM 17447]
MNFQVIKNSKFVLVLFTSLLYLNVNAQCAMCRASLQNDANQATAQGINDGIVYLMAIPYILVAAAAYAVYRIKFHKKKEEL